LANKAKQKSLIMTSFGLTKNGQIYVRENQKTDKIHVKTENDLDKM